MQRGGARIALYTMKGQLMIMRTPLTAAHSAQAATPTDPFAPKLFDPREAAQLDAVQQPLAFDPWAEEGDIANTLSVRNYFDQYIRPELRTPATIDERDRAVKRWGAFCRAYPISPTLSHCLESDRIAYPVLATITAKSLLAFQRWLSETGVPARATNKMVGGVRACLSHAARRGFLARAPGVKALPASSAATIYTLDHREFSRVYHACDVAAWPVARRANPARPGRWDLPYSPAVGWRALLTLLVTYGMRTEDAAAYTADASPLLWESIRRDVRNPHPAGKLTNPSGWLIFTPTKTAAKKPEPLVLPLTPLVRWHLDQLDPHGLAKPTDRVFDWPLTAGNARKGTQGYYAQFSAILKAAGVFPRDWSGNAIEYKPAHLRKTCVTWHETNIPGSSQYITGHAAGRSPDALLTAVQRKHYFNAEALTMAALMTCPILGGFASPMR